MKVVNSVVRLMCITLVCGLMFASCGGGAGSAEKMFSEGLTACEIAEKLKDSGSGGSLKEGIIYQAEMFCFKPIKDVRLIGNFNNIDSCTVEGELYSGILKMYKKALNQFKDVKFKFENGNFYAVDKDSFQEVGSYKQEGEVITVYQKNGEVATTFYYQKGILWQNNMEGDSSLIVIYKKKDDAQE